MRLPAPEEWEAAGAEIEDQQHEDEPLNVS